MKKLLPLFLLLITLVGNPLPYQLEIAQKFSKNYNEHIVIEIVPEDVQICSTDIAYGCTYYYPDGTSQIVIRDVKGMEYFFKHAMFHEIWHWFGHADEAEAENYAINMDGHDYGIYQSERGLD